MRVQAVRLSLTFACKHQKARRRYTPEARTERRGAFFLSRDVRVQADRFPAQPVCHSMDALVRCQVISRNKIQTDSYKARSFRSLPPPRSSFSTSISSSISHFLRSVPRQPEIPSFVLHRVPALQRGRASKSTTPCG